MLQHTPTGRRTQLAPIQELTPHAAVEQTQHPSEAAKERRLPHYGLPCPLSKFKHAPFSPELQLVQLQLRLSAMPNCAASILQTLSILERKSLLFAASLPPPPAFSTQSSALSSPFSVHVRLMAEAVMLLALRVGLHRRSSSRSSSMRLRRVRV